MRRFDRWLAVTAAVLGITWLVGRVMRAAPPPESLGPEEEAVLAQMHRVLSRDAIAPIYRPQFLPAAQARLRPDELVLGVALNDEARAYPITVLNSREMVNDVVGGVPILATW